MPKTLQERSKQQLRQSQHLRQDVDNSSIFTVEMGEYVSPEIYVEGSGVHVELGNIVGAEDGGKILIKGGAGVGKSSALSRLSLLWAEGESLQQFDHLFSA